MSVLFLFVSCKQAGDDRGIQSGKELAVTDYDGLKNVLLTGWNTFDVTSISTQVLLPEGLALNLQINDTITGDTLGLMFTGNRVKGSERVWTKAHTPDGSYTDFIVRWRDFGMRVRTHARGDDLYVIVTPADSTVNPGIIRLKCYVLYGREGVISRDGQTIIADLPGKKLTISPSTRFLRITGRHIMEFPMDGQIAYSTASDSLQQIRDLIGKAEKEYMDKKAAYGELADVYDALQNALNWLVIYDNENDRLISPVSRPWSFGWGKGTPGGYVLFCWDNFFAAFMHSVESKELAFNEAIQMCNEIDELGFVPNYSGSFNVKSRDRSQPPVGSMMVREIYLRHPEKWFLEKTFDQLLAWNRWWDENRNLNGYLCWGSDPAASVSGDRRERVQNVHSAASNESGLDNSPMYEDVPFDTISHKIPVGDVGLMSLYVGDCEALVYIANELGRDGEAKELQARADTYREKIKTMWDDGFGLFLNRRLDIDDNSKRISPTNFYALIARAATQEQAERMIQEHFYNPDEFWGEYILPSIARNDPSYTGQDYWRGSIWAPMNFLVYLGMRNYHLPQARKDLALKSRKLLLNEWYG
ncbi:MAG: hypothetical protein AMS23_07835, partial [Bacteroides sp. SM1_62]